MIWVPWSRTRKRVDFAVWSRERGLLVDNILEEKAEQEVAAALERHAKREAEEAQSMFSALPFCCVTIDKFDSVNGIGQDSLIGLKAKKPRETRSTDGAEWNKTCEYGYGC